VACVTSGKLLYVSGQIPVIDGKPVHIAKLGADYDVADGAVAARQCAFAVLAQAVAALTGDLDRVVRCVKLTSYCNLTPDSIDQPRVATGASDLMVEVFGDAARHARAAVSVASLPLGVAVEVETIFEVHRRQ
jgi:enamine deaminase RidA (YjgF/YER057c/UK114 family)